MLRILGMAAAGEECSWVLPGLVALVLFALLLTRIDAVFAGRAYTAYGGVSIMGSLSSGFGSSRALNRTDGTSVVRLYVSWERQIFCLGLAR